MTIHDDSDLSAAFEELTAPPSTANYATRTSGLEIRTTVSRWPQAVATALAVLVAVAGAGTFLALRNARQGGAPSSSVGTPPGRSDAAMAYDSTAGVTVMFGGTDGSGRQLTDTWTWDGLAWKAAARGPGSLVDVRMVDDPAEAGVLLVGIPAAPVSGSGTSGSVGSGCAGGASGSASPGSVPAGPPIASIGSAPGGKPSAVTGPPTTATLPPTGTPVAGPPVSDNPVPVCPPTAATPTEQTWLFSGGGWNLAAAGSATTTPPAAAELAFDSTTRQVVAVTSSFFRCGPPLREFATDAPIACPALGASTSTSSAPAILCRVASECLGNGTISTWTWSGGYWKKAPADPTLQQSGITLLFDDPATHHATLMTQFNLGLFGGSASPSCPPVKSCSPPPAPVVTTWTWSGSGWDQVSRLKNVELAPNFAGATVASIGGTIVVLTNTGQTWTWAAGEWTQDTAATHPNGRSGATMAQGPTGTMVLFGGAATSGFAVASSASSVGSDTWLWDRNAWRQLGGTAPVPPPSPTFSCPAQSKGVIPPCVQPVPPQVPQPQGPGPNKSAPPSTQVTVGAPTSP